MNKGLLILLLTLLHCVHTAYLHAAQGNYVHVKDSVQLYYQQAGLGQQALVFYLVGACLVRFLNTS